MSISEAERAMDLIETFREGFDPGKAKLFRSLVKDFVSRSRRYRELHGMDGTGLFFDPTERMQLILPEPLDRRLRDWETGPSRPNPFHVKACRGYIRYLVARDNLPPDERDVADIYAPLIQLLAEGASFYMNHGDFTIDEVCTFPYGRY